MRKVVFLPGVGADPDFWRPLADLLPDAWRKTFLGWPGLGNQPVDADINSYNDLARLIEAELGDEPVDLLAQSMGGALAMMTALRYPHKVRRLVLAVTAGGMDIQRFGAQDWRADYRAEYPQAADWAMTERPDMSADIYRIAQPTLLIWGDTDPISPLAVGEYLRDSLPNARLHIVKGGQHDLVRTHSADLAPLIETHFSDSDS